MIKVKFPIKTNQRYYDIHYKYILNIFKYCNWDIEYHTLGDLELAFVIKINKKLILIEYADMGNFIEKQIFANIPYNAVFKFHTKHKYNGSNIYPFSPVSFYDWNQYNDLEKEIKYTCNSNIILNCQRPYAGALERRLKIQDMLKNNCSNIDFSITDQITYWNKINDCLVHVFVGGNNNNILDRGHIQYLSFGCCTISPELPEMLPYNIKLIDMVDYIKCKDDYSDLIEKIEWCRNNRNICIEIGKHAKKKFKKYLIPEKLLQWIMECIK